VRDRIKCYDDVQKESNVPSEENGYRFELKTYDILQLIDTSKFGVLEASKDEVAIIKPKATSQKYKIQNVRKVISSYFKKLLSDKGVKFESKSAFHLY
jgi:hypothetical protein